MIKNLFILGSTGSIGGSTLRIVKKNKNKFKIKLLTANKNISKIYKQAIEFDVKDVVIHDKKLHLKNINKFKEKNIRVFSNINEALKNKKFKAFLTINGISGINGLEPTIQVIKYTKNLAIANKESIICGWRFIQNELKKNSTNFIPLDSEHFSIWTLLGGKESKNIKKIYLTASGGPFLNKDLNKLKNISPKYALDHPNWKMGKKISIDSATMMNKIFEVIEAVKIFNLDISKFEIIIHPKSLIHAVVHYKTGLTKLLAHDTTMEIPILNAMHSKNDNFSYNNSNFNYKNLNGINFIRPNIKQFPLLKILKNSFNNTYFEIILITINDELVNKYLKNRITYISIHKIMLKLLKKHYFKKYFNRKPRNINDVKLMVNKVKVYLNKNLKLNDKIKS